MDFSFEVKESDLLGRVGTLKVGGRTLETPYMFPVIHPVNQQVPVSELKAMGFGGLMTNSYIIHSRRKQEALEKGIHSMLDYDGVFITDSGGYQVLVYGDLEIGYKEVASFQAGIGSDLAVTLDRPTGYPQTRKVAMETVVYSLENAKATLSEYGDEKTCWVGPIQGGLYGDLVRKSAKALVGAGFQFLALGSPVQVMENYMFSELVKMIGSAKGAIPYSMPLHLFGAGHPLTMALVVALGCDTFDSASYVIFARTGRYMSGSGVLTLKSMKYLPCSCPICSRTSVKELLELEHDERTKRLSIHNLFILHEELEACKEAISEGRLWDLVEERSMAHPRLREAFLELVRLGPELSFGTPTMKDRGLFVRSAGDMARPEITTAAARLSEAATKSKGTAVLLPGTMERGSRLNKKERADYYRLHPIIGPYPAELEFQYPFSQTEIGSMVPTVGLEEGKRRLKAMGYDRVLVEGGTPSKDMPRSRRNRWGASPSPRSSSSHSR